MKKAENDSCKEMGKEEKRGKEKGTDQVRSCSSRLCIATVRPLDTSCSSKISGAFVIGGVNPSVSLSVPHRPDS
jgi:hypothetical protein